MNSVPYRSVVCAALLAVSATCFADTDMPGSVIAVQGGRFAFGQVSPYARHQYMLDTQTGRLWKMLCAVDEDQPQGAEAKCKYHTFEPVYYNTRSGDISLLPDGPKVNK